jgi:hypothetical protein
MADFEKNEFKFPDEIVDKKASTAEEEFQIEIEDDTPVADRDKKPMAEPPEEVTDDELSQYDEKVQKRLKKFTKGYNDERRAKEEALRERQAAEDFARQVYEENQRLQQQLSEGSKMYIEQGQSAAQMQLEAAEKAYKEAYESGDTDALVDAQKKITNATLRLDKAQNLKPIEIVEKPSYSAPKPVVTDTRAEQWKDENPWYGDDEKPEHTIMSATALGVHTALLRQYGQGYIGTDDYYEKIDSRMRASFPEYFGSTNSQEPDEERAAPARAKPANVVAPATRSTSPKKVKLSSSQVAIAKRLGVPLELYAKKVAEQENT